MWPFSPKPEAVKPHPPVVLPDAEFDIDGQNVFAIERRGDDTIVSFWYWTRLEEGANSVVARKVKEWYLPTSMDRHADLLARFRAKLAR